MTIRRLLVANRGEIARRVFRTCRTLGIETVAVFADADADLPFVREADVAVRLPGNTPAETYLRGDLVVRAALDAGADAVHPGYGFLSENADFARQVRDAGLTWVGPRPESIDAMGSKVEAKKLMEKSPAVLRYTKEALRAVRFMNEPQASDYLAAKSDALRFVDKEDSRSQGMKQFLDDKTYRPGFGAFKRQAKRA